MRGPTTKIWANSGDSHVMEPGDLWTERMPADLGPRMPRTEQIDDRTERVHIDGRSFERKMQWNPEVSEERPRARRAEIGRRREPGMRALDLFRPPGSWDVQDRLVDLDGEGIWAEIVYPSLGLWTGLIKDPVLYREGVKVANDWLKETFIDVTPRCVPAAEISTVSVDDAVAEVQRAAGLGIQGDQHPDAARRRRHQELELRPVGAALGRDRRDRHGRRVPHRVGGQGPRAVAVSRPTTVPAARCSTTWRPRSAASGSPPCSSPRAILDRHPDTEAPRLGGRRELDAVHRRPDGRVVPPARRVGAAQAVPARPSEIMCEQVYASFQHDKSAVVALHREWAASNILWGADYPHLEGTFGHTQKTLHELFDDVDEAAR